ncbi:MAG: ribonuclease P protein component [Eubacterium sp.]|nr:ribonuclease P protein component [Eubacterium sp.]
MKRFSKKYLCIKKDREFRWLFKKGDCTVTKAFICYVNESKRRKNRIGIVTGKKLGNAVTRNRARRVIREAFRHIEPVLAESTQKRYDIIFVARGAAPHLKSTQIYKLMEKNILGKYANAKQK